MTDAPLPASTPRSRFVPPLTLALLAAATVAAFAGVFRNGWILFDDPLYVYENPHVNRGFTPAGVRWFLTQPHGGNWHPLTSWSHMLDVQLFGLSPVGHHAMSLALHALNAVLLAVVLHRLTGAWWRSVLVAALFAVHPLRVESVAWVSERKDVLSALFFLLTIEAYRRWVLRPGGGRWALVIVCFALGLMAKPMLVTLPFVLVLLDVWPLGRLAGFKTSAADRGGPARAAGSAADRGRAAPRSLAGLLLEKWPLLALAAASAIVTFVVQRKTGAVASTESVLPLRRVCNALISYWRYVGKSAWPTGLAPFYPYAGAANVAGAVAAAAGLIAVTVATIRQARRRPYLVIGWLWFLGMLLPVIGLVQVGGQSWADRYSYLPVIGLLVAVVWGAADLAQRSRAGRIALAAAALLALAALSVATALQVARWKDTRTLFTYALAVTRDNPIAHQCLGDVLLEENQVALAVPHYREAVRLAPDFADAHNKLGSALGALGHYDDAIAQFVLGLRSGENAEVRHNLGYTYQRLGRIDEAIPQYELALRRDPQNYLALVHLGEVLGARNRLAESERYLRRALAIDPRDQVPRRALAVTLTLEGQVEGAIHEYREILGSSPDDLDALNNVAWIRATHAEARHRDGAEAVRLAERARDRSSEPQAVLYSTLAAAYAEAGRFPEAVAAGQRAVALARAAGESESAGRYLQQLADYRAGRPFHFDR